MNLNAIGVGALAAWYFLVGRKGSGKEARDERALEHMRAAQWSSGASLLQPIPTAAPERPPASLPVVQAVQMRALEVVSTPMPAPAALMIPSMATPVQPAPRVLPVAPAVTVRRPVPPSTSTFTRQTFKTSGQLMPKADTSRVRPPILPEYLRSNR